MLARDVMTTKVITVEPDTPIADVARILLDSRISGVPVVNDDGRVLGIVSEGDLLRQEGSGTKRRSPLAALLSLNDHKEGHSMIGERMARDVMTKNVETIEEDTPLTDIVEILERRRIKRVPVVTEGILVGIISRANLLHGLAASSFTRSSSGDDRRARSKLLELLRIEAGIDERYINVTVSRGIAHLWGAVESEAKQEAARRVAEKAPGVRAVHDHLGLLIPELLS